MWCSQCCVLVRSCCVPLFRELVGDFWGRGILENGVGDFGKCVSQVFGMKCGRKKCGYYNKEETQMAVEKMTLGVGLITPVILFKISPVILSKITPVIISCGMKTVVIVTCVI